MLPTGISNMLDSSEKEIFLAGEMDHPNVSKTFSNFDTEPNPEGKFYLMIELGDLGTIASVEDDNSPDPVFILNEKVFNQVSTHVFYGTRRIDDPGYANFCKSLKEKVC